MLGPVGACARARPRAVLVETRPMSEHAAPVLVALVGPSGAGKTTLAAALVRRWSAAGLRVGYVKHASHGFEMDRPGKDTDRLAGAGAAGVAVSGPSGTAYLERTASRDPVALVARFFPTADVVVVEGFREAGLPSVVLTGDAEPAAAVAEARGAVLAVAAPAHRLEAARSCAREAAVLDRDDIVGIAAHLEAALRERGDLPRAPS